MFNSLKRWFGPAAVLCLVVSLASVVPTASSSAATRARAVKNGTYRVALGTDPGNLFPYQTVSTAAISLFSYTYDTLVNYNAKGKLVSGLADRWTAKAKTVTFYLRPGVTCGDGSRLTASDVAADFAYVLDPKNASPWLNVSVPASGVKVKANNARRSVTFTDSTPYSLLLQTTGPLMPIACPNVLKHEGAYLHRTDGTGPYKLTSASPGSRYVLVRRPGYHWGPGGASTTNLMPRKVIIEIIADETTQTDLLLRGQLNQVSLVGPNRSRLNHARGVNTYKVRVPFNWLWFNQRPGHATASPAVREALTLALNLHTLEQVATAKLGSPATSLVPVLSNPCRYNSVTGSFPSSSLARARRILRNAGWRAGSNGVLQKNGKPLDLTLLNATDQGASVQAANDYMQHQWDAIGASVTLDSMSSQGMIGVLFGPGNWDASLVSLGVYVPSQLTGFLSGPTPPSGENFSGIHSGAYINATRNALKSVGTRSCVYWKEAEQALFHYFDLIPFADNPIYVGLYHSRAEVSFGGIYPTSVRMYRR